MEWLSPAALWLLPLAGLPFLLQLRRPPVARREVSSLHLWRAVERAAQAKPALRRIRADRLTLIRAALLLALVVALGRPALSGGGPETALVVDLSPSMGTAEGDGTRLDAARRRAREVADRLPPDTTLHLVAAGTAPQDLGHFRPADAALARALSGLQPVAGRADLRGALDLAWTHAPGHGWVFSDGPHPGALPTVLTWATVGGPAPNVAVTALAAARTSEGLTDVVVTIANTGASQEAARVALEFDGARATAETVRVDAGSAISLVRSFSGEASVVRAQVVARSDALPLDNARVAVAPPRSPVRVRLISDGHLYLEQALRAHADVAVTRVTPAAAATLPQDDADVVVCDRCTSVPQAASVLMIPLPRTGSTPTAIAPVEAAQPSHPLARDLDLGGVRAAPAAGELLEGASIVLRAGNRALLSARDTRGQRVAVLHLDPYATDLSFSPAFPVLIGNVVDWLSGRNERPVAIDAGNVLRWRITGGPLSGPLSVRGPDDQPVASRVDAGVLITVPLTRPGLYTLTGAEGSTQVACQPAVDDSARLERWAAPASGGRATDHRELALLLLLAGLAFAGLEWRMSHPPAGAARWGRIAAGTLLLMAALDLPVPAGGASATAVFVLDRSDSLPLRAQRAFAARMRDMAKGMQGGDRAGVVVFGAEAAVGRVPAEGAPAGEPAVQVAGGGSNLAGALGLARRLLPPTGVRRLVLLSDGRETAGQAADEAARAAADGIRIDVALPELPRVRPVAVRAVRAPATVRAGEPFLSTVVVEGPPRARVTLSVGLDDEPAQTQTVALGDDGLGQTEVARRRTEPGLYTLRASLDGDETAAASGTTVTVAGPPTVLYVGTRDGGGVARALVAAGFGVHTASPAAMSGGSGGLARYDAVVLDDVPAAALGASGTDALARYVEKDGGGLLLLGSARSLELPGFGDGGMGAVLPVDLRPRPGRRSPAAAFIVVFDKSGSMADDAGGIPKIELARQAALRVLDVLPVGDALGVIAFDAKPVAVLPLGQTREAGTIAAALRRIEPSGATAVAPAVELASRWLREAAADRRHVLLVSDGRAEPGDLDRLVKVTRDGGFELSIVAIGAGADRAALTGLATSTGGRAYFPEDIRELPALAARDAIRSHGGGTVEEHFVVRAGDPHPALAGLGHERLPALDGYVVATLKPGASGVLVSHLGDPLLAAWQAGLGRAAVYTADLRSPWSSGLRAWAGGGALWTQTVRWLSRRTEPGLMALDVSQTGDALLVRLSVPRGDATMQSATVQAQVRTPSGEVRAVALRPVAPGQLEGRATARSAGTYQVTASMTNRKDGRETRLLGGAFVSSDIERLGGPPDLTLLRSLATLTGGQVLPASAGPFDGPRPMGFRTRRAWFTGAALLLILNGMIGWPRRTAASNLARTSA